MNRGLDRLEHLFSRYLDQECTAEEESLVESLLRDDPRARALFEEYRSLDYQVGEALRASMIRWQRTATIRAFWRRAGKVLAMAAAACLAMLVWWQPEQPSGDASAGRPVQAASWFAPLPPGGDAVEPVPAAYERPELRLRGTQREWIVIPGDEPGRYFVIEVDRVRTHVIGVHQDF